MKAGTLENIAFKASDSIFTLEVRPFGNSCPIGCRHCYQLKESKPNSAISNHIIGEFIETLMPYLKRHSYQELTIIIHGGEPLCDGGKWFERFIDYVRSEIVDMISAVGIKIGISCHTSGNVPILFTSLPNMPITFAVTELCCHELRRYLGVPKECDDIYNDNYSYLNGKGFLGTIMMPVTKEHRHYLPDIVRVIRNAECNVKMFPVIPTAEQGIKYSIGSKDYATLLHKVWAEMKETPHALGKVEPYSRMLFDSKKGWRDCRYSEKCSIGSNRPNSIVVDSDGKLYPCNKYAGVKEKLCSEEATWNEDVITKLSTMKRQAITNGAMCDNCVYHKEGCSRYGGCPFIREQVSTKVYGDGYCVDEVGEMMEIRKITSNRREK